MKSFDTIIVGGGIIGASIALELATRGQSVRIIDRQRPGQEASWAAAGMLAPDPESPKDAALLPLARMSLSEYPRFIATIEEVSGMTVGFSNSGSLMLYFGAGAQSERDRDVATHRDFGLSTVPVSITNAREIEPSISAQAASAAWLPYECSVDPRALTHALLTAVERKGVEVRSDSPARNIFMRGGRCTGVVAGGETLSAGRVIIAAGCYSGEIEGISPYAPTSPVRGQIVVLQLPDGAPAHVLRSQRGYVVPRSRGRLIAGSTTENAGFEKNVTAEGVARIRGAATELAPCLASAAVTDRWSGLRPDTPDHLPVLGSTDIDGLWIATGHYRNGILLAPGTARVMSEWITEGKPSLALEKFSPLRFAAAQKTASR